MKLKFDLTFNVGVLCGYQLAHSLWICYLDHALAEKTRLVKASQLFMPPSSQLDWVLKEENKGITSVPAEAINLQNTQWKCGPGHVIGATSQGKQRELGERYVERTVCRGMSDVQRKTPTFIKSSESPISGVVLA